MSTYGVTKQFVVLIMTGCIFILLSGLINFYIGAFLIYNFALLGLFLLDVKTSCKPTELKIQREFSLPVEIGKLQHVTISVYNNSKQKLRIILRDSVPAEIKCEDSSVSIVCGPGECSTGQYEIFPVKRGDYVFGNIAVRLTGPLGLCIRQFEMPSEHSLPIYPDLQPLKKYRLLANNKRFLKEDAAIRKVRGIGTDFQGLREYTSDDEFRKINWQATARTNKLISNIYDVEKSQDIIIAVDTGRTMISQAEGLSRLDHSVQSALVLAQAALMNGDRVGLLIFGDKTKLFLKPSKNKDQINKILDALYPIQPEYYESDYNELVSNLQILQRKRSLVCLFTHIRDEESCRELAETLTHLNKKHVLMLVSVINPGLKKLIDADTINMEAIYGKSSAIHRLNAERNASLILSHCGITNIITEPGQLTPEIINRYIAIKKQMKL